MEDNRSALLEWPQLDGAGKRTSKAPVKTGMEQRMKEPQRNSVPF